MSSDVINAELAATLTVCDLPDGALQQVFDDGRGRLVVGEIAGGIQTLGMSRSEESSGLMVTRFAPRVLDGLANWRGPVLLRLTPALVGLPWVNWLAQLGVHADQVQQIPTQHTDLQAQATSLHSSSSHKVASHAIGLRGNRHVSSLSYDLVGSTELIARIGAETYAQLLSRLHRCFADIALTWGGQADLAQGDDGCMCHFGVLQSLERPDLAALQAVWAMALAARREGWPVRLGLASGWVVVDSGLPVGLSVHLAARLQKLAPTGHVYVSGALAKACEAWFEFQVLPTTEEMKGFELPQSVAELIAPFSAPVQLQTDMSSVSFVGRQPALTLLDAAWDRVTHGEGVDVLVVGEAGIGKSSLLRHWLTRRGQGKLVPIRCGPHDQRLPFAALAPWVARQLGYSMSGNQAQRTRAFEQRMSASTIWQSHAHAWRHLFELPPAAGDMVFEEASAAHQAVIEAVVAVVSLQAAQAPIMIAVEDYHWIDASSAAVVTALRQAIPHGLCILLLVTQRPPEIGQASYQPHALQHRLIPLSDIQSRELASQISPSMGADETFMTLVNSRSQGVPLFLRECARLYNSAEFQQQLYAARRLGVGLPVPESLQSLMMHRLDQLGALRQLAQVGSVLGDGFSWRLLQAFVDRLQLPQIIGMSLKDAHDELVQQGVWAYTGGALPENLRFVHALIRDAAYQSMWETDRKRLHAVAAEVLAEMQSVLVEANATQLARHLAASGQIELAVGQLMEAGKRSKRQGAHQVARETMGTALQLLELLPDVKSHHRSRSEAHLALAGQIMITEGYGSTSVIDEYGMALEQAHAACDDTAIFRAQLGNQLCHFMKGDFVQARQHLEAATQVASHLQHPLTTLQCEWALANLEFYEGDLVASERRMQLCISQCEKHRLGLGLLQNPQVMATLYRAFSLACLGFADEARQLAKKGCTLANYADNRLAKVQAYGIAAMVAYACGEWQNTLDLSTQASVCCAPSEYALWLAHAHVMQGASLARLGKLDEGLSQMRYGHNQWAMHGGVLTRSYYWALEADILADAMRLDEAQEAIQQARQIVNTTSERYYASEVTRIQARIILIDPAKLASHDQALAQLQVAFFDAECRRLHGLALRCAITSIEYQTSARQPTTLDWQQLQDALDAVLNEGATSDTVYSQLLLKKRSEQRVISIENYR
jgi:class 3 adenylate cyclase/tetratricopeptide (TPR) repeat protein/ABC-type transport system involved in cytochrome c biogenesis ATPase subunit